MWEDEKPYTSKAWKASDPDKLSLKYLLKNWKQETRREEILTWMPGRYSVERDIKFHKRVPTSLKTLQACFIFFTHPYSQKLKLEENSKKIMSPTPRSSPTKGLEDIWLHLKDNSGSSLFKISTMLPRGLLYWQTKCTDASLINLSRTANKHWMHQHKMQLPIFQITITSCWKHFSPLHKAKDYFSKRTA